LRELREYVLRWVFGKNNKIVVLLTNEVTTVYIHKSGVIREKKEFENIKYIFFIFVEENKFQPGAS
jgi:hypothetical protein